MDLPERATDTKARREDMVAMMTTVTTMDTDQYSEDW